MEIGKAWKKFAQIVTLTCLFFSIFNQVFAQIPDTSRITAWQLAGLSEIQPEEYRHLSFLGDTSAGANNSPALQTILDTITQPTIILFGEGNFRFLSRITLKSNTIIKGLGNQRTQLIFNQGGVNQQSIQMRGSESGNYSLLEAAAFQSNSVLVSAASANNFKAGDYFRLVQEDADLVMAGWGNYLTGQIIKIDSIRNGRIYFPSPLRMDYPMSRLPKIRKMVPVKFSGIECLKITREDYTNTGSGSSNIDIRYSVNCHISSVESYKCNYSHAELFYSSNILIEDCYFHDAFNFGDGGRAYGVMLHYGTGEVLVQNNIFRQLRHAMILQAGANGNVFAYNYAYEGKKQVFGFIITGEDMVCHGNYPYLNLFEGNYAQFGHIDNSHEKNGPFNTYFRNIATTYAFRVSGSQSGSQNFTGNHSLAGSNSFSSTGHHITDNSWQGASSLTRASLAYTSTPPFLSGYALGQIGPPGFNNTVSIPSRDRALADSFISRKCDIIIWENGAWADGFKPSAQTKDYTMIVYPGANLVLSANASINSLELKPGANLQVAPGKTLTIVK